MSEPGVELLSGEEIEQMADCLRKFPPLVPAPVDLPFFDVRRIVATLQYLSACMTNYALRINVLVEENEHLLLVAQQANETVNRLDDPYHLKLTQTKPCSACERLNNVLNHFCRFCGQQLRETCALCEQPLPERWTKKP